MLLLLNRRFRNGESIAVYVRRSIQNVRAAARPISCGFDPMRENAITPYRTAGNHAAKTPLAKQSELGNPPPGYDGSEPLPDPNPVYPSPPHTFKILTTSPTDPPAVALQNALAQHRLLFLWHAFPCHEELDTPEIPSKQQLWQSCTIPSQREPIEVALLGTWQEQINRWHEQVVEVVGNGWGRAYFDRDIKSLRAYWTIPSAGSGELQASCDRIHIHAGLTIEALMKMGLSDDVAIVRQAAARSLPMPANANSNAAWDHTPFIALDYPDELEAVNRSLHPIMLMIGNVEQPGHSGVAAAIASADFTSVTWNGKRYDFNPTEAKVVEFLARKSNSTSHQRSIGSYIGNRDGEYRLDHTFRHRGKMHSAWGTLIVRAGRGTYRLAVAVLRTDASKPTDSGRKSQ